MTGDLLKCNVLATHTIANVSETLAQKLGLPKEYRSIGILTADSDDVTYCALDEATKASTVRVSYARSCMRAPQTPTRSWPERSSASWPVPIRRR